MSQVDAVGSIAKPEEKQSQTFTMLPTYGTDLPRSLQLLKSD